MELVTKCHGTRTYSDDDVIVFKKGLPGFKELKKFIIFPLESNDTFTILHSIEDNDIGLILVSPFTIALDYEFKIPDACIEELQIKIPEEVLVLTTVTLNSSIEAGVPGRIHISFNPNLALSHPRSMRYFSLLNNPPFSFSISFCLVKASSRVKVCCQS